MTRDPFHSLADSPMAPAENCFPIVPDDAIELVEATKAIYVGSGGDVVLRALRGEQDVTFVGVPTGAVLDVRARIVRATGTSAANIVGLA